MVRRLDGDIRVPAKSTIHAVLNRHSLVKRGSGPRHRARGRPLSQGTDQIISGAPTSRASSSSGMAATAFP
jgi:hypothetical protein